jgi:bifunctional non-homologous end joining protein LigD
MSLTPYRRKRNFRKTAEPAADSKRPARKTGEPRLHYDLRLEIGGAFKSWAVPKGLPYAKGEKHLAVHVEDHPLAYGNFEGTIPEGEYGGGTVMLWDHGTFTPLTPVKGLKNGKLHFVLHGEKLNGEWYLVRLREGNQWLVIKGDTDMKPLSARNDDTSVLSGKSMRQIAAPEAPKKRAVIKKTAKKAPRTGSKEKSAVHSRPRFVEPMKAKLASSPPPGKWLYEIKFDGWRALALKGGSAVQLYSRNQKDFSEKFPEIVEAIASFPAEEAVLDGEIVAIDGTGRSSFQLLQAFDTGSERPPILYYVFDLLQLNGKDLTALPLTDRKATLEKLLKKEKDTGLVRYSAALGHDGEELLEKARELDIEGLIGKRPDSIYEAGSRSGAWIKLKIHQEQEFVIGGYTDPEGSRQSFGSLIVGYYAGRKLMAAGKVGTGFDQALLRSLHTRFKKIASGICPFANLPASERGKWGQGITASEMKRCHWLKPKLICQVKFSEWTRDGRLRQPVFLGLRPDKKPSEVVREIPV